MNPPYFDGDPNYEGKTDTVCLIKECSTGKIGIATVDRTTGKLTILGAVTGIGNGGDDLE